MAEQTITVTAPAKLNINLRILGRRADGMHNIDSVMTPIDFADSVMVTTRGDGQICRRWRHPQVRDDLCLRAAELLRRTANIRAGADIVVQKRIPIGGGLGGGSSNAAAVLLALNRLWQTHLSAATLMTLAAQLGADVPFFLFGKTARARGIGDQLSVTKSAFLQKHNHFLLLCPKVVASTAAVYAEYKNLTLRCKHRKIDGGLINNTNDLAAAVFHLYPQIATAARRLRRITGEARLSGSGACVYAAFQSRQAAQQAQASLPAAIIAGVWRGERWT